jgi:hypothetical protein
MGGRNDLPAPGITLAMILTGKDPASRNATVEPDLVVAMLTIDRTNITADLAPGDANVRPTSTALVAVTPAPQHAPVSSRMSRPDPSFVAHLIATAEQAPQTRRLRRAAPQEALSAYAAQARLAYGFGVS